MSENNNENDDINKKADEILGDTGLDDDSNASGNEEPSENELEVIPGEGEDGEEDPGETGEGEPGETETDETGEDGEDEDGEEGDDLSSIPTPDSADDLVSEKEKKEGFLAKGIKKVKAAISGDKPKKENGANEASGKPNSDGSSPSTVFRSQIPVSREENERANLIEQERVLADHKRHQKYESKRTYQFISPLEKHFEDVSVKFKNKTIFLKVKNGIYRIKESDYAKHGSKEEFVRCLVAHKFTEV